MRAGVADFERDNLIARTTAGRDERGAVDGEKGARMPWAYVRRPALIEIDEQAAQTVRRNFELRDQGLGFRRIAAQLNAEGKATPRGAAEWSAPAVRTIVMNEEAYKGGPRNGSGVNWPRIVP